MKLTSLSIKQRLVYSLLLLLCVQASVFALLNYLELGLGFTLLILVFVSLLGLFFVTYQTMNPIEKVITALDLGVSSFNDKDFSITLDKNKYAEFSQIISSYNELASIMRDERMSIYQRELLLDTVIQSTPVALVLTNRQGHIVYSNLAAKTLLNQKRRLEGLLFEDIYKRLPPALYEATKKKLDGLITETFDDQSIVYHLNCQSFTLNKQSHYLYLYKNLTAEMSQKETDIWKQVIRLISHELNNSLAPIHSLTNSAKKIIDSQDNLDMLPDILDTIARRSSHLHDFISQYANFAKLPKPCSEVVNLKEFIEHLTPVLDIKIQVDFDQETLEFDEAQIEQVLINLVKNAKESGSKPEDICLQIVGNHKVVKFTVLDKGKGMTSQQLSQALLPFYSTKSTGTGIGLTLCNEIVVAHGGKLKIVNRQEGGLSVSFELHHYS